MISRERVRAAAARVGPLTYIAGATFLAAVIVATTLFGCRYYTDRQTDEARTNAANAAHTAAIALLAYDYNTAATTLPKAAGTLTGDFQNDYLTLIKTVIIPGAQQKQLMVHVDVRGISVVSAAPHSATVLLFLNQSTTDQDAPKAVVTGARLRLQMQQVNGRWLVSNLTPI